MYSSSYIRLFFVSHDLLWRSQKWIAASRRRQQCFKKRCFLLDRVTDASDSSIYYPGSAERFRCVLFMRATIEARESGTFRCRRGACLAGPKKASSCKSGLGWRERGPKDRDRNIRLTEGEFDRWRQKRRREGRTQAGPAAPLAAMDWIWTHPRARSLGCSLRKKRE